MSSSCAGVACKVPHRNMGCKGGEYLRRMAEDIPFFEAEKEVKHPVQISMNWDEAAELHETLSKQWHNGIVAEFVRTLGERLKERPKT